jgi:four helix bundle protein
MKSIVKEKSFSFALDVIQLYQRLKRKNEFVLSKQLLRSATSIGANVEEALAGQSRRDFLSKMSIASKEARETCYWLQLMTASKFEGENYAPLLTKAQELKRMLTSVVKTTAEKSKDF